MNSEIQRHLRLNSRKVRLFPNTAVLLITRTLSPTYFHYKGSVRGGVSAALVHWGLKMAHDLAPVGYQDYPSLGAKLNPQCNRVTTRR